MGSNTGGHVRVLRSIEHDDIGYQVLVGFRYCRCELYAAGGGDQHRLSADASGSGAYQIRDRLVVGIHRQTGRHRAIAEHLEPIREQYEWQIAAEVRDEDNWLAVAEPGLASEIDRLPGDRHRID